MSRKHNLKVLEVNPCTDDSVAIKLEKIPSEQYKAGQYLALELDINGEQVNRSYSFCSSPHEANWEIGVKHVPNGKASTFLNKSLTIGDTITSLEPMGNFTLDGLSSSNTHYLFYAAGSGITPVFSMIKSILNSDSAANITLFYGNKSPEKTMFKKELEALCHSAENFQMELLFSEDGAADTLHKGRMNFGKTLELLRLIKDSGKTKHAYICGPGDMITSVSNALMDNGFSEDQVHREFFTVPTETTEDTAEITGTLDENFTGEASVKITLDDEEHDIKVHSDGEVILDAALNAGLDAPFSCKGGVCTACRAKVTKGSVKMDSNFALTDGEIEEGFILTCQSHPKSAEIELSFDE